MYRKNLENMNHYQLMDLMMSDKLNRKMDRKKLENMNKYILIDLVMEMHEKLKKPNYKVYLKEAKPTPKNTKTALENMSNSQLINMLMKQNQIIEKQNEKIDILMKQNENNKKLLKQKPMIEKRDEINLSSKENENIKSIPTEKRFWDRCLEKHKAEDKILGGSFEKKKNQLQHLEIPNQIQKKVFLSYVVKNIKQRKCMEVILEENQ